MKQVLKVIKNILVTMVVLIAISMMIFTIFSVTTINRNDRSLLGYKAFIVLTDSMSATDFDAGDLILVKEVDPLTLQEGDIIAFESTDPDSFGEVITHKIRSVTTDADGSHGFITYGTTTGSDDQTIVHDMYVIGKYVKAFPKVGVFFRFLKTTPGYFVCIFTPFMLLILYQGANTIALFRRYRQEQLDEIAEEKAAQSAEIAAERARLEAERMEQQQMLEELRALRAQLTNVAATAAPPAASDTPTSNTTTETGKETSADV